MKKPIISIIMPVFNASEFLSKALESVLWQTYSNWELICVNDNSIDNSLQILKAFAKKDKRIKILSNSRNRGIGYSLNKALKQVKGDFIARMDADDIALPDRLEKQLTLLKANPDIVACGGQAAIIDPSDNIIAYKKFPTQYPKLYKMIMKVVPIQHPILMTRAKVFKNYRYLETISTAEDVDLLFYILEKGKIANVNSIIYLYRKSNLSNGYHDLKKTFFITFKTRLLAIKKYHYKPTLWGILCSIMEFIIVGMLPSRVILSLFEKMRFEPISKKTYNFQLSSLFSVSQRLVSR
jgi:glycosyltransferase involved in cell wall biosynthesis